MRASRPQPLGFTLLELMITGVIASIAIAAVAAVFLSQTQLYQQHETRRSSQSNARLGISLLEQRLREAGYGVEPPRAVLAYDSYDAASNAQGPNYPDAIVVHSRDTLFARTIAAADNASVQILEPLTAPLRMGQILLAVCTGGSKFGYAVVSANVAAGETNIPIGGGAASDSPAGAPGPIFSNGLYGAQPIGGAEACFDGGGSKLFRVQRSAFYVAAFDDDRDTATPVVPYLMLHDGTDTSGDGTVNGDDATPLAAGVEQLQFAYIMNTLTDAPPPIVGVTDAPGYGEAWAAASMSPLLAEPYDSATRLASHPANIRQIRTTIVSRSLSSQTDKLGDDESVEIAGATLSNGSVPWKSLENLALPVGDPVFMPEGRGYARSVLRVSVAPKNMLMRTQFQSPAAGGG